MWEHDTNATHFAVRALGTLLGALVSLIVVAPPNTRNALYRLTLGVGLGIAFGPALPQIPWLAWLGGNTYDLMFARAVFAGLFTWITIEGVVRLLSNTDWAVRLAEEILIRRGGKK